jgi:WD40 repeat protein
LNDEADMLVPTSDGKRLLLTGLDHVYALDAASPTRDFASYATPERLLAVGQGGLALVLPSVRARVVHLVDVATGRVLRAFSSDARPECAAISADNTRVVVGAVPNTFIVITVWDATSGDRLSSMTSSEVSRIPLGREIMPRCIVATSPDGSVVLSSRDKLEAWSSSTGVPIPTVEVSPSQTVPNGSQGVVAAAGPGFAAIAVSADGRRAAIGRVDGSVAVLDLTSRPINVQIVQTNGVRALALSPNGERLAVAATRVSLWSVRETPRLLSWFDHDSLVYGLAFSSDGDRLVGLCGQGQVHTWRTTYMAATTTLDDARPPTQTPTLATSHTTLSPSGRLVASGDLAGTVSLWRLSDASQIARWTLPESKATESPPPTGPVRPANPLAVRALSFSGNERVLALGYENGAVGMRRVPSGEAVREFAAHPSSVMAMATSADGRWLATGALDGTARVWDWATGALQAVFFVNGTNAVGALAFRRDSSLLVGSTPGDGPPTVFLWDWRSQRTLASAVVPWSSVGSGARERPEPVTPIAINPVDGRIAMGVGHSDSAVSIWDSELTREVGRLVGTGGHGEMRSVDFSPDGERLVTAEQGGGIRVWSADRLELLAVLDVGGEFVRFTPDGRRLIAAGSQISVLDSGVPKSSFPPRLDSIFPPNVADRAAQRSPEQTSQRVPKPPLRSNLLGTWLLFEATGAPMWCPIGKRLLINQAAADEQSLVINEDGGLEPVWYHLDGRESTIRMGTPEGVMKSVALASVEANGIVIVISSSSGEQRVRYYLEDDRLVCEGEGGKRVYRRPR